MDESIFDRNIVPAKKYTIGEDTFHFKPLTYQHIGQFWKFAKSMTKHSTNLKEIDKDNLSEEQTNKMMDMMDEETITDIISLSYHTIKASYPDLDDDKAKAFAKDNMFDMMGIIMELNIPNTQEDVVKAKKALAKDERKE